MIAPQWLAGLLIVDADVDKVDWSAAGTWVWTIGMGCIALMGVWLAAAAYSNQTTVASTR